jgi:hypothetical protein
VSAWRLVPITSLPVSANPIALSRNPSRFFSWSIRVLLNVVVLATTSTRSGATSA